MSRYYLHLRDFKGDVVEDEDGSEFASLVAAKQQAMQAMHEIVGEAIKRGDELQYEAIILASEDGTHLAAVPLLTPLPSTIVGLLKHPEAVLSATKIEEYRRNADDCRGKAENTADPDDKMSWLKLADAWLRMLPVSHAGANFSHWPKASDEDSTASH